MCVSDYFALLIIRFLKLLRLNADKIPVPRLLVGSVSSIIPYNGGYFGSRCSHIHRQEGVWTVAGIMIFMTWDLEILKVVCVRFSPTLAHVSRMWSFFVYVRECRSIWATLEHQGFKTRDRWNAQNRTSKTSQKTKTPEARQQFWVF